MDVTFIYLMFVLKLPIAAMLYIVWYAVKAVPEPDAQAQAGDDEGDGGSKVERHPRPSTPPRPRRGPHGGPSPTTPKRTRRVVARGRRTRA